MAKPVLEVSGLKTHFHTRAGVVRSVDGLSFILNRGEILGLVGESGSGKSVTGFSIMGLIDAPGKIVAGDITLNGRSLIGASDRQLRKVRGRDIAMIFQDPMMTLTPVLRVDTQMIEAVQAHENISRKAARDRSLKMLELVGIPAAAERLKAYPHQLSGGMRQRVAIAIALLHRPSVIIADEPTTALDVTIQSQILSEIQILARDYGTAIIWITHDLGVVSNIADKIAVMYAGRIVEQGLTRDVIGGPRHPYTAGLLSSLPSQNEIGERLKQIPGMAPSLANLPPGCSFAPRCERKLACCMIEVPEDSAVSGSNIIKCHNAVPLNAEHA